MSPYVALIVARLQNACNRQCRIVSHGLSQKELASALRVHRSTIHRWMRSGILRPNEHYFRIADRGPLRFNLDRIIESCKIATYLRESVH